jgi:ATP-dependent Clp protease ATP-binding subunit ClpA
VGKLAIGVLSKAAQEARRLRQNWLGPEHYLLALLAEPSIATEVLAALNVTHERLAAQLSGLKTVNGRRIRYVESKGIMTNPAAHAVTGWAKGYAAARGRKRPTPEDWLLAIVYRDPSLVASILHELGVSGAVVVKALRRRGVKTPEFEPAAYRPWRGRRALEVARSEWRAVVDVLSAKHPPGSEWQWGFNSRNDRAGRVQFSAEDGIDLDAIVAEARAGQSRGSLNLN